MSETKDPCENGTQRPPQMPLAKSVAPRGKRQWPWNLLWAFVGACIGFTFSMIQYKYTSQLEYEAHRKRITIQWINAVVDEICYNAEHWTDPPYPITDPRSGDVLFLRKISTEALRAFVNIKNELDLPDSSIDESAWDLLEWTNSANDLVEFYNSHVKPTNAGKSVDTLRSNYQMVSGQLRSKLLTVLESLERQ